MSTDSKTTDGGSLLAFVKTHLCAKHEFFFFFFGGGEARVKSECSYSTYHYIAEDCMNS